MRRIGFEFHEIMSGTYTLLHAGQAEQTGRVSFQVRAHAKSALAHMRDGMASLEGTLDMEHFADDVPLSGTLEIRPILGKIIRYRFTFVGNDGNPYRFDGQKDIQFGHFVATMTTLNGAFYRRDEEIARATLHFDVKADLLPFLVSFKPAVA